MASYRVYYCDGQGKIFSADDFEAGDDTHAIVRAMTMADRRSELFEVWQRDRMVHRSNAATQTKGDKPPPLGANSLAGEG